MYNKVVLVGKLTKDPKLMYGKDFTPVCFLTVKCDGEFVECVAFRNMAEKMAKNLRKGSQVVIDAKVTSRLIEVEGQDYKEKKQSIVVNSATYDSDQIIIDQPENEIEEEELVNEESLTI